METAYEIPKISFEPGEEVPIIIDCDNSAVRNAVKSFKFKLFRRVETAVDHPGNKNITLIDAF